MQYFINVNTSIASTVIQKSCLIYLFRIMKSAAFWYYISQTPRHFSLSLTELRLRSPSSVIYKSLCLRGPPFRGGRGKFRQ
jgi:hypothetical protein